MSSKTKRSLAAAACAAACISSAAPPAMASGTNFLQEQGLSAQNAYGSGGAHAYVAIIQTYTREPSAHTACPAVGAGYGGYTSTPFSNGHWTAYQSSLCGPGFAQWSPNPTADVLHGVAFNPNSQTYDYFGFAYYGWNS